MGDPFRVISLQHYPPHGLAPVATIGKSLRDYQRLLLSRYWSVNGLGLSWWRPFFDEHCMKIRNHLLILVVDVGRVLKEGAPRTASMHQPCIVMYRRLSLSRCMLAPRRVARTLPARTFISLAVNPTYCYADAVFHRIYRQSCHCEEGSDEAISIFARERDNHG